MVELLIHIPLCILSCIFVHILEKNVPWFRRLVHLDFTRKPRYTVPDKLEPRGERL
jgi:hypothetical protein